MGTFHHDAHPLHGITCVVETQGTRTYVGRVDREVAEGLVLLDADVHDADATGPTRDEFLLQAARFGHWPRAPRVVIPSAEVVQIRRLSDLPAS